MLYFVAASAGVWLAILGYVLRLNNKQLELWQLSQEQGHAAMGGTVEDRPYP